MNQQEFLNLLRKYEEAYYSGESLISDEEYDALKDQYVSLYGEYEHVPQEGSTGFKRVKHLYPLKSLDKIQLNDKAKLRKELERLWPVVIQPKFDGLSIEIQPDMKFITRGNGEEGDDVTSQCMQIQDIDLIGTAFDEGAGALRAEIIMTHTAFRELNEERVRNGETPFSNCRNAAAGMLRNLDLNKIKGLTVMIYEDLSSTAKQTDIIHDLTLDIGEDDLEMSEDYIRMTPIFEPADVDAAIDFLDNLEGYRKLIDYDIDGWVVKSNIENSLEHFGGYTGHHPKNAFAVKGEAKGDWTRIKSITWQVGKENITPVAELEPVEIEGSVISRATLHNVSIMKALGLNRIGSINAETIVKVVKANDVIPRILEVKHIIRGKDPVCLQVEPPKACPVCDGATAIKETDSDSEILICTNVDCRAKLKARIEHMVSREALDITGLSEGTITKIMDTYEVVTPTNILNLRKNHLLNLEGFADKSATNIENSILKAIKTQPINKVLYASAIPLVGKDASNRICKVYTIDELSNILAKPNDEAIKDLCKVKGIGKETAQSLVENKEQFRLMFVAIDEVTDVAVKNNDSDKEQYSFCITGQREPFKSMIESAGHKLTGSVSKKTKALVDSSGDLTTSKAKKALELGIPIIKTAEELEKLL